MSIQSIVKNFIPNGVLEYKHGLALLSDLNDCGKTTAFKKSHIYVSWPFENATTAFAHEFRALCKTIKVPIINGYLYPFDIWCRRIAFNGSDIITSITPDYSRILDSSLKDLSNILHNGSRKSFIITELSVIKSLYGLKKRIVKEISKRGDSRSTVLCGYYNHMLDNKPESLDEALQKILFYNGLFWQVNHWHNGLGRLDLVLYEYFHNDLRKGILTRESAKELLRQFVLVLGEHTIQKSLSIKGDTGQYILIGGINQSGTNVDNELTELFLEVFTELNIPDPKLIIRVNKNTSNTIWEKAISCITTGCGSPLIMNEALVMEGLIKFGYKDQDVWNVGTSACWEPLIIGKSFDQNNPLPSITIIKSLNNAIIKSSDNSSYEDVINSFKQEAAIQIKTSMRDIDFDVSPLYSLFFDSCIEREMDYTRGGADYAYHGVQIVSFPNLINAILNVKKYVFDEKLVSIAQCKSILSNNFEGNNDIRELFLSNELKYGSTNADVVDLTNNLMRYLSDEVAKYTINGKKVKMGFSSPQYITNRGVVKTSLDGRKDYEPFAVHISPFSHNIDIQEIMDFAGSLDYNDNRLNGNVVDFILPPSYVQNPNKLISILKNAMTTGVFELQLNILDKNTLIDAKAHPEKYPNLIVRVWGFSAYFNDLPEVYKDNLIQRAEKYNAN